MDYKMPIDAKSAVIAILKEWAGAQQRRDQIAAAYLFGSLIYRDGVQFGNHSDVDLVVVLPKAITSAIDRVERLLALREAKVDLEGKLTNALGRDPSHLTCSIVPVTPLEVRADVHKDGAEQFFQSNSFMDLLSGEVGKGLPNAGASKIANRFQSALLRFCQKKRNQFLAVSADGNGGIADFADEHDPLPKDMMRHAAMGQLLSKGDGPPGAEYDVQYGLDFITHLLYERRDQNALFAGANNRLSVRRKARGVSGPMTGVDQMLINELLFGLAANSIVSEHKKKAEQIAVELDDDSEVEFAERFGQAFPGVRDVKWFENEDEITERLTRLLAPPLERSNIWWFRDGNMHIEHFAHLQGRDFLMDGTELNVSRIAAVPNPSYFREFVYLEFNPMKPTGLYPRSEEIVVRTESGEGEWSYYCEEYAIVDSRHLITRGEFDDGAAKIEGKLQDTRGRCELRSRYLTRYNFVIAPNGSPINSPEFDNTLEQMLDGILAGTSKLEDLVQVVSRLPRNHR